MKIVKQSLLILAVAIGLFGCKKDSVDDLSNDEIFEKRISDIIPQQYQDSLIKLGIVINKSTSPPTVNGAFSLRVLTLVKSNIPSDKPNRTFSDTKIKFFDQDANNTIKFIARQTISADTSIVTAISGSGNKFTIYGKRKSVRGSNSAIFGMIYSGEIEGDAIKNLTYGLINIDNSDGGTEFINEGQGRVIKDNDMISERIPMF